MTDIMKNEKTENVVNVKRRNWVWKFNPFRKCPAKMNEEIATVVTSSSSLSTSECSLNCGDDTTRNASAPSGGKSRLANKVRYEEKDAAFEI